MMPAQAPGVSRPWAEAMESQLAALTMLERLMLINNPRLNILKPMWAIDRKLLPAAVPYAWNHETTQATLAASRSVPLETPLSAWNLDTNAAWWHFDTPLPFRTVNVHADRGIRALLIGWVFTQPKQVSYPRGTPQWVINNAMRFGPPLERRLSISCWLDDPEPTTLQKYTPSQTMNWRENDTFGEMLDSTRQAHIERYGPGSKLEHEPQVGLDVFMEATEGISKFILAGLSWLGQRVLTNDAGHIERHRRKDFQRTMGTDIDAVRVISLRKVERPHAEPGEPSGREYDCRWTVDGHWRNQVCGVKNADRKLTWIHPYIKGPDDKPLKVPTRKVYVVNR